MNFTHISPPDSAAIAVLSCRLLHRESRAESRRKRHGRTRQSVNAPRRPYHMCAQVLSVPAALSAQCAPDRFIYLFLSQFLQDHVVYIARFTLRHGLFEYLPLIKQRWSYYALLKTAAHQLSSLQQRQKPFRWRHLPVSVCFDNSGGIVN